MKLDAFLIGEKHPIVEVRPGTCCMDIPEKPPIDKEDLFVLPSITVLR